MDFLNPLFEAIGWLLALFYSVIPNLGVSIILLTFTIMLILYPLTAKQAKSMIAMQRVQPEVKKLQAKYKGDRQKLNEEMMQFYKENKINPLAGCLPLLAQLPIFFSLFRVLRDPEKYVPTDSALYADLCHKAGGILRTVEACAESVNHLKFLGMDLQLSAVDAHSSALERRAVLPARRSRDPHRVRADPAGPEAHAGREQADGHGDAGPAGVLRAHLAAVPGRSRPLLLREQPLASRSTRGHLPAARLGAAPAQGRDLRVQGHEGHRSQTAGWSRTTTMSTTSRKRRPRRSRSCRRRSPSRPLRRSPRRRTSRRRRRAGCEASSSSRHRPSPTAAVDAGPHVLVAAAVRADRAGPAAPPSNGAGTARRSGSAEVPVVEWVETTGRTVEAALDAALDQLGVA